MSGVDVENMFAAIPFLSWPGIRTKGNSHITNPVNVLWFSSQLEFVSMLNISVIKEQPPAKALVTRAYDRWTGMVKDLYKPDTPLAVVRRKYKFWLYRSDYPDKDYYNDHANLMYFDKPKQGIVPMTMEPLAKIFFEKHKPYVLNEVLSRQYVTRRWDRVTKTIVPK